MDLLTFGAGIGLPAPFKVVYDRESKSLKDDGVQSGEGKSRLCFNLVSADLKLSVKFSAEDFYFCGFEFKCGDIESLAAAKLVMPCAPDGFIKIEKINSFAVPNANLVLCGGLNVFYDAANKLIAVGNVKESDCFYRICENMCVGIGGKRELTGFLIKIY